MEFDKVEEGRGTSPQPSYAAKTYNARLWTVGSLT